MLEPLASILAGCVGAFRESNSRPLAPEARIIPLDQMPFHEDLLFLAPTWTNKNIYKVKQTSKFWVDRFNFNYLAILY